MARKSWDNLSPAYRARLERGGITPAAYERGVSLSAARGHRRTPERPERAERNPERFHNYLRARQPIRVISTRGEISTTHLTKKERSLVGKHRNAINKYLDEGVATDLERFEGVTVGGRRGVPEYELETRLDPIDEWARAARFDVDYLYENTKD